MASAFAWTARMLTTLNSALVLLKSTIHRLCGTRAQTPERLEAEVFLDGGLSGIPT
jgi:hypothetical protein